MAKNDITFTWSIPCPCKGCKKRHEACHDDCPAYRTFRKVLNALRAKERKEKAKR